MALHTIAVAISPIAPGAQRMYDAAREAGTAKRGDARLTAVLQRLADGRHVPAEDALDALFDAMATTVTRYGDSTRKSHLREELIMVWNHVRLQVAQAETREFVRRNA